MANKFEYRLADGPNRTPHDDRVSFSVPYFFIRRIITHHLHIDNAWGDEGIGYDMIIGRDLMV